MVKQLVIQEELTENEWVQCATAENEVIAYKIVKIRTRNEGKRFRIIDWVQISSPTRLTIDHSAGLSRDLMLAALAADWIGFRYVSLS